MDIITHCLTLAPGPYHSAFSLLRLLWDSVDKVQACKEQLRVLSTCVAQLLTAVHTEVGENRLTERGIAEAYKSLCKWVSPFS